MKKHPSSGPGETVLPGIGGIPMLDALQLETMLATHQRMFACVAEINDAWVTAVQETMKSGSDLATHLSKSGNPVENINACNEWLRERSARLMTDGQRAAELWTNFYRSALQPGQVGGMAHPRHGEPSSPRAKRASSEVA